MKITKLEQSCLLVEMPAPVSRTALFDPGSMSEPYINVDSLEYLDDIIITHGHGDHFDMSLIKKLVQKFPQVRITAPHEVVQQLKHESISASSDNSEGIQLFEAPHENVRPMFPQPEEIGVHYLNRLTHPGDSHSFNETKAVLALPMTAPWGSMVRAVNLALELKPQYIVPVHDWHWKDEAKAGTYANLVDLFKQHDIKFLNVKNGEPVVVEV